MRSAHADALILVREVRLLLEQESIIFASPEDVHYFRSLSKPVPKKNKTTENNSLPLPLPLPIPKNKTTESTEPNENHRMPPPSVPRSPLSLKSLFAKIAPDLPLLEEIPSDAFAKKIATRWKTKNQTAPISLLSLHEPPEQKALLHEIAKALDVYFGPAKIVSAESIERDKQWEVFLSTSELKLIISCDYTLWQLSALMPFYRELPTNGMRTLKQIPLFLLPDLSLYLKDPPLKRSLWKALCQKLST